jgi:hypothetical protein
MPIPGFMKTVSPICPGLSVGDHNLVATVLQARHFTLPRRGEQFHDPATFFRAVH